VGVVRAVYNSGLARRIYRTGVGRFLYHAPAELYRWFRGQRNPLVPPLWSVYTGRGDYEQVGRTFLEYFREFGGLEPDHRVLDIGSGMGRMAVPLTTFLSERGSYAGLEIVKRGVEWCTRRFTRRFPQFRFVHADIRNDLYNPRGAYPPESYRFPFEDRAFDFVFLTSVFTHMAPDGVRNYLHEIARVLKPGRRCLFTCSIMDETSRQLVAAKRSSLDFSCCHGEYYSLRRDGSTDDVAFEESWIRDTVTGAGLTVVEPIRFGAWSGRSEHLSMQDIVVVQRP